MTFIGSLLRDESAQGLLEYALIITFVATAVVGVLKLFGNPINHELSGPGAYLS